MDKKQKLYFTKEHEDAIIRYVATQDIKERTKLYVNFIEPVFDEMVDKIVYTYKFVSLPNIDDLRDECKIWLVTILDKFNQEKGYKAFSYFSVITKNWFIHKVKKNAQNNKKEIQVDGISKELECKFLSDHDSMYEKENEKEEFWVLLLEEINSWDIESLKPNERRVLDAVKILFSNINNIEIFNKKAFYLYLRELTGLNTKQIVSNLSNLRVKYKEFRDRWNNSEI